MKPVMPTRISLFQAVISTILFFLHGFQLKWMIMACSHVVQAIHAPTPTPCVSTNCVYADLGSSSRVVSVVSHTMTNLARE